MAPSPSTPFRIPLGTRLLPILLMLLTYHGSLLRHSPSLHTSSSQLVQVHSDGTAPSWWVGLTPPPEGPDDTWWGAVGAILRQAALATAAGSGRSSVGVGADSHLSQPVSVRERSGPRYDDSGMSRVQPVDHNESNYVGAHSENAQGEITGAHCENTGAHGEITGAHSENTGAQNKAASDGTSGSVPTSAESQIQERSEPRRFRSHHRPKRGARYGLAMGYFNYRLPRSSVPTPTYRQKRGGSRWRNGALEVEDTMYLLPPASKRDDLYDKDVLFDLASSYLYSPPPSRTPHDSVDDVTGDEDRQTDVLYFPQRPSLDEAGVDELAHMPADSDGAAYFSPSSSEGGRLDLEADVLSLRNLLSRTAGSEEDDLADYPAPSRPSSRADPELAKRTPDARYVPVRTARNGRRSHGSCLMTTDQQSIQMTLNTMETIEEDYMTRTAYYRGLYARDNHNQTAMCASFSRIEGEEHMNNLSLCPWRLQKNYSQTRFPRTLWFAQCICGQCSSGNGPFSHTCMPLYHRINVIHELCESGLVRFRWSHEDVPVGCFCARQSNRATEP